MNAVEFLEKIKEIIPSFSFDGNFEFRNDQKNYKIAIKTRDEDLSLYCDIEYNKFLYYYNFNNAFDDHISEHTGESVKLEVVEDLFEKIDALVNDKEFDTRVTIQLDLEEDVLEMIYTNAHKMDITVNQYVEHLLNEYIKLSNKGKV